MTINQGLFTSITDEWATPQWLFDELNAKYHFQTDVCALPSNAKCKTYYSPRDNGLNQEWKGRCWMNPPYGREIIWSTLKPLMTWKSNFKPL